MFGIAGYVLFDSTMTGNVMSLCMFADGVFA